jgi:HAD superfamily hydrolase (TIGR01490 family)
MAVVLVDVDGTLVDGPSCERRFIGELFRRGILGTRQCTAAAWFVARWTPRYGRHTLKKNKAYLAGLDIERVAAAAEAFARSAIAPKLRPSVLSRIAMHRARGDAVALLTGTPDFLARPLAAALGVAHWSATRCATADGRFTAAPPAVHPFDRDKLALAQVLCESLGSRLEDAIAYADSAHDLPLLHAAGRAVAVAPDARLRAVAEREGWEVLD